MKYMLTAFLLYFGLLANAQRQVPDTIKISYVKNYKSHSTNLKGYTIDGKFIESNQSVQFNPTDIKDIKINNSDKQIYILTNNPKKHKFLTLNEITTKYLKLNQGVLLYIVNNEIIRDIESYKIDENYILSLEVYHSSDFEYLKDEKQGPFNIVKILLRTPENIEKATPIRIR